MVIDAFSRKVVGWSMGECMTADLVLAALNMALHTRKPDSVIHHSDKAPALVGVADPGQAVPGECLLDDLLAMAHLQRDRHIVRASTLWLNTSTTAVR